MKHLKSKTIEQRTVEEIKETISQLPPRVPKNRGPSEAYLAQNALKLLAEYARRETDAFNLYRPLPNAQSFHESSAKRRIITGSNRSGKTVCSAWEVAKIVRGKHPDFPQPGIIICVGKDDNHIGQVQWKSLGSGGTFTVIPDEVTGLWRAVRPDPKDPLHIDPIDDCRRKLMRPAGPLVPLNEIEKIAWRDLKNNVPGRVLMRNGWEMLWHSSNGSPRAGIKVDAVWFDEEIMNQQWLPEMLARLPDREGWFFWSCTPQSATKQLLDLHNLCSKGEPDYEEFKLYLEDNPFLSDKAKRQLKVDLTAMGEEELNVRYYGQYAILGRKVYPSFDMGRHGITQTEPPEDWMRIMAVDPGIQTAAAVFCAIPPGADELHVYDEIYIKNASAAEFAKEVHKRTEGRPEFEAFIMDYRGGKQRGMGHEATTMEHYSNAMRDLGIKARLGGGRFVWGTDDIEARTLSVKRMLSPNSKGHVILRIHRGTAPNLVREMENQYYHPTTPDKRDKKYSNHAVDCLEYAVAFFDDERKDSDSEHGLYYDPPLQMVWTDPDEAIYKAFQKKKRDAKKQDRENSRGTSLGSASRDQESSISML